MAIYQRQEPGDTTPEKIVGRGDQCRHLVRLLPESGTALLEYPAGSKKSVGPTFPQYLPLYFQCGLGIAQLRVVPCR